MVLGMKKIQKSVCFDEKFATLSGLSFGLINTGEGGFYIVSL